MHMLITTKIRKLFQNTLHLAVIKFSIYDHEFSATLIQ